MTKLKIENLITDKRGFATADGAVGYGVVCGKWCPLCKGSGFYPGYSDEQQEINRLRALGLTIREIARVVGKKPTTIHYWLHKL